MAATRPAFTFCDVGENQRVLIKIKTTRSNKYKHDFLGSLCYGISSIFMVVSLYFWFYNIGTILIIQAFYILDIGKIIILQMNAAEIKRKIDRLSDEQKY